MKNLLIFITFFLLSCEKNKVELTGLEGTVINEEGEKMKTFKLYYGVFQYHSNLYGGAGYQLIDGPKEVLSDENGTIKISENLKTKEALSLFSFYYKNPIIDSMYVSSAEVIDLQEIKKGQYYKDVILTIRER